MAKKPTRLKISDQIRHAIETCGMSRYRIAKDTGIDQSILSRVMSGERGLTLNQLDTLGEYLGLRIVNEKATDQSKPKGK